MASDDTPAEAAASAAASEAVEVVDEHDRVLRTATRAEVRADRLRHRCTFVAVVDGAGRVVVHQRAPWKDVWPLRWDLAFGGVSAPGEGWHDAARRELREEAGIDAGPDDLVEVGAGAYDDDAVSEIGRAFVVRSDAEPTFDDGEVVASDRVPLDALPGWLATRETCPDSVHFLAGPLAALGEADRADG